jgi:hypothetical protein
VHPAEPADVDLPDEIASDPRWDLLHDLARRARASWVDYSDPAADRSWSPIRVTTARPGDRLRALRAAARNARAAGRPPPSSWNTPPPLTSEISVVFDARVSLRALIATLRETWPTLAERGIVRRHRNRALGRRKIELLRFVCLADDATEQTWEDRLAGWNALVERNVRMGRPDWTTKWKFNDDDVPSGVRALRTMCHDVEEQLTGSRHGLIWFYDAKARAGRDIGARPDVADRIREMGIQFDLVKGGTGSGKTRKR